MKNLNDLNIKIFADGANLDKLNDYKNLDFIKGYTTNPSLMKNAGIVNYKDFALKFMELIGDVPVSFEVFADEMNEMELQASEISSWNKNIIIKVPITNSKGISTKNLIKDLTDKNISINVTAIFTLDQINEILDYINKNTYCILSIFAGRVADTGIDPIPIFAKAKNLVNNYKNIELLWASPRELLNIFQANDCGTDIITVSSSILDKFKYINNDLTQFSIETVKMFFEDSQKAGYKL